MARTEGARPKGTLSTPDLIMQARTGMDAEYRSAASPGTPTGINVEQIPGTQSVATETSSRRRRGVRQVVGGLLLSSAVYATAMGVMESKGETPDAGPLAGPIDAPGIALVTGSSPLVDSGVTQEAPPTGNHTNSRDVKDGETLTEIAEAGMGSGGDRPSGADTFAGAALLKVTGGFADADEIPTGQATVLDNETLTAAETALDGHASDPRVNDTADRLKTAVSKGPHAYDSAEAAAASSDLLDTMGVQVDQPDQNSADDPDSSQSEAPIGTDLRQPTITGDADISAAVQRAQDSGLTGETELTNSSIFTQEKASHDLTEGGANFDSRLSSLLTAHLPDEDINQHGDFDPTRMQGAEGDKKGDKFVEVNPELMPLFSAIEGMKPDQVRELMGHLPPQAADMVEAFWSVGNVDGDPDFIARRDAAALDAFLNMPNYNDLIGQHPQIPQLLDQLRENPQDAAVTLLDAQPEVVSPLFLTANAVPLSPDTGTPTTEMPQGPIIPPTERPSITPTPELPTTSTHPTETRRTTTTVEPVPTNTPDSNAGANPQNIPSNELPAWVHASNRAMPAWALITEAAGLTSLAGGAAIFGIEANNNRRRRKQERQESIPDYNEIPESKAARGSQTNREIELALNTLRENPVTRKDNLDGKTFETIRDTEVDKILQVSSIGKLSKVKEIINRRKVDKLDRQKQRMDKKIENESQNDLEAVFVVKNKKRRFRSDKLVTTVEYRKKPVPPESEPPEPPRARGTYGHSPQDRDETLVTGQTEEHAGEPETPSTNPGIIPLHRSDRPRNQGGQSDPRG